MTSDPFEIVGTMLDGRYRVDEVVGEGGFGVVYRGFHPGFDAPIAIKVLKMPHGLRPEERQELLETFHQEGKLLFTLSKLTATFVQVMEKGVLQREGQPVAPYLVLEWLDGRTLDAEMRDRRARGQSRCSLDEVIALLDPVAEALALAHIDWKVAHRDVKPENIFLVRGARGTTTTKLLDFGIAKVMTSTGSAALNEPTLRGGGGFTPQYAAPEQWNRKYGHTGPWSDVYAFALVCVELLSGRSALEGDETTQLFGATIDPDRPTPSRRGVLVPPQVEQVFLTALAVKPHERYREMRSFWDALKAARTDRASAPLWSTTAAPGHLPAAEAARLTPPPPSEPVITQLALAPTILAPAGQTPPPGGPAQMGWQAQGPGIVAPAASVLPSTGALNTPVPGRARTVLVGVGAVLALLAVGGGFFLFAKAPSTQASVVSTATNEGPNVDPPASAGPGSESPIGVPAESPGGVPAESPSGAPAESPSAPAEPSGAPAASSTQALGVAGASACQQRSDCKDGKRCVRGVCRNVECTENRDCSGPRVCNKLQNKCEWSVRGIPAPW